MTVTMHEAIFTRDTSTFLKMSPKYVINWKDEKVEGKPAKDGGKTPKWNSKHSFNIGTDLSTAGVMHFTFLDDNDVICDS